MDHWLTSLGAMHERTENMQQMLRDHGAQIAEIKGMIRELASKPQKRTLDMNKLTPKIISVGIIGAAAALQLLPTQVAIKLISSLL
jgi:hypothetical protein